MTLKFISAVRNLCESNSLLWKCGTWLMLRERILVGF